MAIMNTLKSLTFLTSFLLLYACSSLPPRRAVLPAEPEVLSCLQYYGALNKLIGQYQVKDAQTVAVGGYPFLHVNRFLAGITSRLDREDKRRLWLTLAAQLALQTQSVEINNLPPEATNKLADITPVNWRDGSPAMALQQCSQTLLDQTLASPETEQKVLRNAKVPDDYDTWKRIVGLYPLVSFPIAAGIHRWHKDSTATLETPRTELPVKGTLRRYNADTRNAYQNAAEVKTALDDASRNALDIPLPDDDTLQRLFATFLPVLEVDTVTADDRIGAPEWHAGAPFAVVNTNRPSVYTLISHAYFNDRFLLQLIYVVWFPGRPCTSSLDSLCGHMDGITWRVTLGVNGEPLIYDSIHNCGCYHTFFPTQYVQANPPPPITVDSRTSLDERAFSPIKAPALSPPRQLVVRIANRTHYVESLYMDKQANSDEVRMSWQPYNVLRSLPVKENPNNAQNRSLFAPNALVAGTQRKERWFFWPLGVPSAGAMRQWGNHATAFIGRRHFDDPYLFENSFTPAGP
jgi:hypothetical protein